MCACWVPTAPQIDHHHPHFLFMVTFMGYLLFILATAANLAEKNMMSSKEK